MNDSQHIVDILYIEDDEVDIQGVLREFGRVNNLIKIEIARNGQVALDKLHGQNGEVRILPTVILLDINLPQMDGLEFLRNLRESPQFANIIVYILTASYGTKEKLAIQNLNVRDHIIKPFGHDNAIMILWDL
jgi:CheY-like chemotaxis protein